MKELVELEEQILAFTGAPCPRTSLLIRAKKDGFADRYLAQLLSAPGDGQARCRRRAAESRCSNVAWSWGWQAWEAVPVSGVEDAAYYYSTYNAPDTVPVSTQP